MLHRTVETFTNALFLAHNVIYNFFLQARYSICSTWCATTGPRDGECGLPRDTQGLLGVRRRARARDRDDEEAGLRPHAAAPGGTNILNPICQCFNKQSILCYFNCFVVKFSK